jgi:hypothetical protein
MKLRAAFVIVGLLLLTLSLVPLTVAQTTAETTSALPRLIRFSGTTKDLNGTPLTGVVGITFALYSEQTGGAALWIETQNVTADNNGHYVALLGSTKPDGLPADLFTSEQAHWVGVQVSGQTEQPRVLLASAPYALKAGDAETIGGLPPSAFVLANSSSAHKNSTPPTNPDVTGKGTVDYIPMWDTTSDIIDSVIFQKSSEIGIATTTPAATLDVNGKTDIRNTLTLYPDSTNNTLAVNGTSFKISSTGEVTFISGQTFPGTGTITGITTASGSGLSGGGTTGTLSLKVPSAGITNAMLADSKITLNASTAGGLTVPGAMTLGDTYTIGLKTCGTDQVLQYKGTTWGCATIAGTGTITGVTAGTDLTGGGTSGTVTLNLNTAKVPQLAAANTFTGNQTVDGNLSATGVVTGSSYQIGSNLFDYGSYANGDAFLGFAGVGVVPGQVFGSSNTAVGDQALYEFNSLGSANIAVGYQALYDFSGQGIGSDNIAVGYQALYVIADGVGSSNTAVGHQALYNPLNVSNVTAVGYHALEISGATGDTAIGYNAGANNSGDNGNNTLLGAMTLLNSQGAISNSTAVGVNAEVTASNALVLGCVAGTNNCTTTTSVGIGTTAPAATLDVHDNGSGGNTISATSAAVNNTVYGINTSTSGNANGASFWTASPQGTAVVAVNTGTGGNDYAGFFQGNVYISGSLAKGSGSFKIDHPLDPANKYLYHSFVESPDMMNVYNGVATLDARGSVWITLPEYFEALNQDFRYQLTSMGKPQPSLYVAKEISGNRFRISGGKPGGKVSWQVTGIRHDAYADAHRIEVEVEKPPQEQGRYLHPELFGAPAEQAIGYHAPAPKREIQEAASTVPR